MNYLVIDLEMCMVPKHYRSKKYQYANEIIQVGAVLLDEAFEVIGEISQFVHPEYGVIDHFISKLTGIQNSQIKNAPCLKEILHHLLDWIGDREYKVYAWSSSDFCQLKREICTKGLEDVRIREFMDPEKWIDYQEVFGKRFDFSRSVSLEESLMYCNIDVEGHLHDGLADAVNTAKLIKVLESDASFTLYNNQMEELSESAPLNYFMGDLFAGLKINFAN